MDAVVHFEIPADDVKRAQKFYKETFGWGINEIPQMEYTMVQTAKTGKDGMSQEKGKINGGIFEKGKTDSVVLVLSVADLDKSLKRATDNGAEIFVEPNVIPNVGRYARIKDTEGNIIGLLQPQME